MRKTRLALAAAAVGLLTAFSASSAMAVDYSEPVIDVGGGSAADGVVAPGEEFTLFGDFGGVECDPWTATFEGDTITGSGTTWAVEFTAPTEPGTYPINFTCTYDDPATPQASGVSTVIPFEVTDDLPAINIVVEGDDSGNGSGSDSDSGDSSALPDTGGSNLLLIAGGAALVVAGAGVLAARRRNS